jgi:hypothetical protein
MKSAFINLCAPEWQQELLKTGINKYSSTWVEILAKAKALEQAEVAIAKMAPAPDQQQGTKRDQRRKLKLPSTEKCTDPTNGTTPKTARSSTPKSKNSKAESLLPSTINNKVQN